MGDTMKNIIRQIIEDNGLDCKRIVAKNLEVAGTKIDYGTPHTICYYTMKSIGKRIYMEYDEYRNLAREVLIFDI